MLLGLLRLQPQVPTRSVLDDTIRAVEALLFVSIEPTDVGTLSRAAGIDAHEVEQAVAALAAHYESSGHGIRIERSGAGLRLVTTPETGAIIAKMLGQDKPVRLSAAALDALAIVAYMQPVTRLAIEAIRGVGSDHVLTVLLNTGLIEEVGREETLGRPVLYATTPAFLANAGLTSLAELPPLAEPQSQ
jgi:segregation and condensation protein B